MTLLLSNILPSDRIANLPLQKYPLVCVVPTWVSMHIVQLISDAIFVCRDRAGKIPSGPEEVQQGLGVASSKYGSLSVLGSVCRPQQSHQAPLLIALSSRIAAPPGRLRAKHHNSIGMAGSGQ